MSRYSDQVRDEYGRLVPGVSVYVYKWDADAQAAGQLETLTDDSSAPLANPLTTDADGLFYFNSVDGQKLLEYHYGGKVRETALILVGALPVPQSVFGGLLANAAALTIPTGMDKIATTGADAIDHGAADYVAGTAPTARSGFTSANARNFVLSKEQVITPQMFYQATDPDFQNAAQAAVDYLKTFALNTGGGGFYKGSPKLIFPAGLYDLHAALDINHTLVIEGEGSGRFGPGAGGCTRLRWADGSDGLRIQHPNTHGTTGTDVTAHDGSGGVYLKHLCLEGGYGGTESDHHGLVCRAITTADDLYIKNWPGEGIKGLAGNQSGGGSLNGNFSVSFFKSVRCEDNRIGTHVGGGDGNVVTFINCESYQNRQAGIVDDNGAGNNTYIGHHAASNGMAGSVPTQCTFSGNHYAAKWGGDFTVAPSGDTSDTANWIWVETGTANSLQPAHTATPNTFRAGGDYVTINSATAMFRNCYSEGSGFSQFADGADISGGSMTDDQFRGGIRRNARTDGYQFSQSPNVSLILRHRSTQSAIVAKDELNVEHSQITFSKTAGNDYYARDATGHRFFTMPYNGAFTLRATVSTNGLELPASHAVYVNSQKVVGARGSAVARITRTATSGSLPTPDGSITIANAATPTVVELLEYCTEIEAKLEALTATMRAATGHGLIA